MVNPEFADHLREKAAGLPLTPGVYIMRDRAGKVIYVGKSKKLKNRVSQYFHESDFQSRKTDAMTFFVADFEYILCDTEIEALSLENSLIKLYRPRYNVKLKDDKSYPYLKATVDKEYPEFMMTRRRENDRARYFGPYTASATVFSLISTIEKTFDLPSCRRHFPKDKGKVKNCIYRQMGCVAPCLESVTAEQYREAFMQAVSFLSGEHGAVIADLEKKMISASENLAYESAARYRDRIAAIKKLSDKQKVVESPDVERDVIAWQSDEVIPSACVFYVRGGRLIDSEEFFFGQSEIADSSALSSFVYGLYTSREYIPKDITFTGGISDDDLSLLSEWLTEKAGYKVNVRVPQRGDAKKLCDMAYQNAVQKAREKQKENEKSNKALERLAMLAGLEVVPERIEAYDISNYGSEHITAGMVVYEHGKPKKSDYRVFNIKQGAQDDYGAMREVLTRRIGHKDENPLPDLFLIDGGENHVAVAREVLTENGLDTAVLGMVKDEHHKTRALVDERGEISIALEQPVFVLIYGIQEEVHRFTVARMTEKKRKTIKRSTLENIDGIGEAKAKLLLKTFGGLAGVRKASVDELASVKGVTPEIAEKIKEYLMGDKK
ncbi:MAG: excinuclease ABC subunit UvrC [Clostridia bacterium]|nr:excinuclease ABC subunit UvrC [Clostridia bacterium]